MIKILFFDLDGTLLSHSLDKIPESSREALKALRARGLRLCLATGRHPLEMAQLPLEGLVFDARILVNGQLALDERGRLIRGVSFTAEAMRELNRAFDAKETGIMFVERDRMYVNTVTDAMRRAQASISSAVPPVEAYGGAPVYQAVLFGGADLGDLYRPKLPGCELTKWQDGAFDVIPAGGGKAEGVRAVLDYFGFTPEEAMAIGDGENDAGMLAFAGLGVAMGNASAKAKAAADHVTSHIDEGGFAEALRHFGLIE